MFFRHIKNKGVKRSRQSDHVPVYVCVGGSVEYDSPEELNKSIQSQLTQTEHQQVKVGH